MVGWVGEKRVNSCWNLDEIVADTSREVDDEVRDAQIKARISLVQITKERKQTTTTLRRDELKNNLRLIEIRII